MPDHTFAFLLPQLLTHSFSPHCMPSVGLGAGGCGEIHHPYPAQAPPRLGEAVNSALGPFPFSEVRQEVGLSQPLLVSCLPLPASCPIRQQWRRGGRWGAETQTLPLTTPHPNPGCPHHTPRPLLLPGRCSPPSSDASFVKCCRGSHDEEMKEGALF